MKFKLSYFFFCSICSCKDDNQKWMLKMKRRQKKGSHFSNIKRDGFYAPINETAEASVALD
jgi:hypothetical protein